MPTSDGEIVRLAKAAGRAFYGDSPREWKAARDALIRAAIGYWVVSDRAKPLTQVDTCRDRGDDNAN